MSSQAVTPRGGLALGNGKVGRTQFPSMSQGQELTQWIQPAPAAGLSTQIRHFLSMLLAVSPEGLKSSCAWNISQGANLQQPETHPGQICGEGINEGQVFVQMQGMCRVSLPASSKAEVEADARQVLGLQLISSVDTG